MTNKLVKSVLVVGGIFALLFVGVWVGIRVTTDIEPVATQNTNVQATDGTYISWREHRIDDEGLSGIPSKGADGLALADLDKDGREDIVSVHEDSNHIRVSFGANNQQWQSITLMEGELIGGVEDADIADMNSDGWLDLLFACEDGSILYFENPGINIRNPESWSFVIPESVRDRGSWIKIYTADLDGDGRLEMIAANKGKKMYAGKGDAGTEVTPVSWFEIPSVPLSQTGWQEHVLGRYIVPVNARPIDIDQDGDMDILAGSRGERRMVLFENSGETPVKFKEIPIIPNKQVMPEQLKLPKTFSGMQVAFADMNKDGRLDIVSYSSPWSVVWLEQPENLKDPWQVHPIGVTFPDSTIALSLVDINGDGRLDLMTGGYSDEPRTHDLEEPGLLHRAGGIVWFEQPESLGEPWTRHDVSRRMRGMYDAFIARDVNGDGLMDFIGTRGNSDNLDGVIWLEQVRTDEPVPVFAGAHDEDSRQLPLPPGLIQGLAEFVLQ